MTNKDFGKLKVGSIMHITDYRGLSQILVLKEVKRGRLLVKWDKYDSISTFSIGGGVDSFTLASDPTPTTLQWVDEICEAYEDEVEYKTVIIQGGL